MKNAKSDKKSDFSRAYEELEEIVRWFEREDADLDESLAKFERGLELAKQCQERLKEVENRVKSIKAKFEAGKE
ncbi:MAG: exodeoxyribonuclease VII small subunit [Patescibacteria group bacterium]|nr:exodeoxyribonuclease VII small subunit [Patescibacteria group bacterium]